MSRTTKLKDSPCKKFLKWKTFKDEESGAITGAGFVYYDKAEQEDIPVELPFKFAVIDPDLTTFKGFNEPKKSGVWSNEGKEKNHVITLSDRDGAIMSFTLGSYKERKAEINAHFAKYVKSVYIAVNVEGEWELWNLQLGGSQLTGGVDRAKMTAEDKLAGWFGFTKAIGRDIYNKLIEVKDYKIRKKGDSRFTVPNFTAGETISEDLGETLDFLDNQLKEYLEWYFDKKQEKKKAPVLATAEGDTEEDNKDWNNVADDEDDLEDAPF